MIDGKAHGRVDPAYAAHTDPITAWSQAVWSQWLPSGDLDLLSSGASSLTRNAKSKWGVVHGPAAACWASVDRLNWQAFSTSMWATDLGMEIDLRCDSPAFVQDLVVQAVHRWRWRRIEARHPSLAQGTGGFGAHFQPLAKLCYPVRPSALWSHEHAGALRSAVTNRQWTQIQGLQCLLF